MPRSRSNLASSSRSRACRRPSSRRSEPGHLSSRSKSPSFVLGSLDGGSAMPALRLFAKLAAYYVILGIVIYAALRLFPGVREFLPVGGVEALISQPDANPL